MRQYTYRQTFFENNFAVPVASGRCAALHLSPVTELVAELLSRSVRKLKICGSIDTKTFKFASLDPIIKTWK